MLWPLLVEYTEPGIPMVAHAQQQGNMALFLTLFILTCVEVLIVKVAQSERELENLLTPHDPPFSVDEVDEEDDDCKLRLSLEEEAIKTRRGDSFAGDGLCTNCSNQNGSPGLEHPDSRGSNAHIPAQSGNQIRNRSSRRISCTLYDDKGGLPLSQIEEPSDGNTVQIREQIEKLVEKIVGGSLDGVSVGKLSKNACYLAMFVKHHDSLCQGLARLGFALHFCLLNGNGLEEDSPQAALSALKSSINKVISEAVKLPRINEIFQLPDAPEVENDSDFSSKSYEDILATAILNKIIEQSQKRRNRSNSKKSRGSTMKNEKTDSNYEEETELMYNSDWSDTSRSEQLSLTIEEHIEEITTTYENSDDEEEVNEEINLNSAIPFPESGRTIWNGENSDGEGQEHSSATEIVTSGNSWEENWLFQRKRLRSRPNAHHPVPVPMLVPNPFQDYRALIGGVDADDLSDMSECSDSALEDVVLARDGKDRDIQTEEQNELSNGSLKLEETEDIGSPSSLNSESSCPSLSQRERDVSIDYEYFQKMDIELKDRSLPVSRSLDLPDSAAEKVPLKCQIAEREKEKWKNAVPLPDNPYSPENIRKWEERKKMEYYRTGCHRESSVEFPSDSLEGITKEPSSEMYSRDYYVKASRCPTGDPNIRTSPVFPIESFVEAVAEKSMLKRNFSVEALNTEARQEGSLRERIAEKTNIMLPNVKELTKKFAKGIEEVAPKPKATNLKRERAPSVKSLPGKESQCEKLECENSSSKSVNSENLTCYVLNKNLTTSYATDVRTTEESGGGENVESGAKDGEEVLDGVKEIMKSSSSISKFAGKEVHSLTARSISKEFREELRSNSSRRTLPKVDRGSSGESDHFEIASELTRNRSPTPPIDLQSKRKFWEDIISNSQK